MRKKSASGSVLIICLLFLTSLSEMPVRSQDIQELNPTHYVLPDFVAGIVKMKNGKVEEAVMNYNMLSEEMIFVRDGENLAMDKPETIDTVYLGSRKFIPNEKFFYEVLLNDTISLFIRHKCNLLPAGSPTGYGGTTETGSTTSITMLISSGNLYKLRLPYGYHTTDASQFWVAKDNLKFRISNERSILKIYPEWSREIKQFIMQNKLDIREQPDLIRIIKRYNELIH